MQPDTRYAKSGDVHIAYQVFGEGPVNLVIVPGFVSNIELFWDQPELARFLLRTASYARVAMFDKRGTGLSDRVAGIPHLDERMDDLRSVMDAAGMEQAAVFGVSEGGALSMLFAATYPDRCRALMLGGPIRAAARRRSTACSAMSTEAGEPAAACRYLLHLARMIPFCKTGGAN
jgi:pimeloyl-ACP methyl ester carboxylesterase